jgi:hypothetical protein
LNIFYLNYSSLKLSQIFVEAEKVINVPLSQFDIKHLLKGESEITNFTINKVNIRNLSENNHPIVKIARNIFGDYESGSSIFANYLIYN